MLEHLRALAVFAKTVELGSFRAASRELGLSPSVVSHHVSELERKLSVPLLYRSTRRLSLTAFGEKLFESARTMLHAAERGIDEVSGRAETAAGSLRLTAPAFFAETPLCRDLAAFSASHPNVTLTVSFTEAPRDLLRDRLDLAFRVGLLADSSLKSRKLASMRRVLVASRAYVEEKPRPRTPQDLASWDFVKLTSRPAEVSLTPRGEKKALTVGFAPKVSVDSAAAIRALVIAGAGLATLPEVTVRQDLAHGRLVEVLPTFRVAALGIYALFPNNAQRPGLTLRFIEHMATRIAAFFGATPARTSKS